MNGFLNYLNQIVSVTSFGLRTMGQRRGASSAAVFGIAGVVAVLVGALATADGFTKAMTSSVAPEGVLIMRSGADSELMSGLDGDEVRIIADTAGIARGKNGPMCSPELFVIINLPLRSTMTDANVPMRGVTNTSFDTRKDFKIVQGRSIEWGKNELIVGVGAALQFAGLELGKELQIGPDRWTVVGLFSAAGGMAESEIWTDAAILQAAYRRGNTYQSVHLHLESADRFTAFKDQLTKDPRLNLKILREADHYAEQSQVLRNLIQGVGFLITILMAIGALFGALNTMYSAVSTRTREIATLRALGFRSVPIVLSVLAESLVLSLIGGLCGGGLMFLLLDGYRTGTLNWQTFSQVTFSLQVSVPLLVTGIAIASFIGLLGGLFPAIRAARLPIATALREL